MWPPTSLKVDCDLRYAKHLRARHDIRECKRTGKMRDGLWLMGKFTGHILFKKKKKVQFVLLLFCLYIEFEFPLAGILNFRFCLFFYSNCPLLK